MDSYIDDSLSTSEGTSKSVKEVKLLGPCGVYKLSK